MPRRARLPHWPAPPANFARLRPARAHTQEQQAIEAIVQERAFANPEAEPNTQSPRRGMQPQKQCQ
jgi:hypothetical protein